MKKVLFILGELDDDDIDWILATGNREEIPAETILIQEGRPIDAVYFLLEGELSVSTLATAGAEIATLYSGEVVGEMSFVDTRLPSATVQAKQPSIVLSLARATLESKLHQDIGFASRFYRALAVLLSNRLRLTVDQLAPVSSVSGSIEVPEDELDREAKDSVALAEIRLDWILRRLKDA
jgi:bacteriocin-type transport-associated protein